MAVAKKDRARKKINTARLRLEEAETFLKSVTAEELGWGGYATITEGNVDIGKPSQAKATNMVYDVFGHAIALRIVRESFSGKWL